MQIVQVGPEELEAALASGAPLVDVRQPDEYVAGHVPGALLVPLGELVDREGELPEGSPLFLICRSGARSQRAAEYLAAGGREVVNVAGGTLAWVSSGRAVVAGPRPG